MRGSIRLRWRLTIFLMLIAAAVSFIQPQANVSLAAAMQGKGGTIKPASTPTPATKTTSPKKSAKSGKPNRAGASTPTRQTEPETAKPSGAEIAFWESIKDSKNPEEFRAYLKKYPNGEFAELARSRLDALEAAAEEEAARKEEARRKEEETRRHPGAGAVMKNSIGMELVYVPPGSFMMGDTRNYATSWQAHRVTIREGFYMGRYEVTQVQWQTVMGTNPSTLKGDNLPVETVSWNDVQEFIKRLNARADGFTYRLPSEAEWEYAERAGTTTTYFWGEDRDQACQYANIADETYKAYRTAKNGKHVNVVLYDSNLKCSDRYAETAPVGSFQPNAFGLYDMTGNVWEMCEDFFHENYNEAPLEGNAWLSGEDQYHSRVIRGGSWNSSDSFIISSYRARTFPSKSAGGDSGFRVVAVARTR